MNKLCVDVLKISLKNINFVVLTFWMLGFDMFSTPLGCVFFQPSMLWKANPPYLDLIRKEEK